MPTKIHGMWNTKTYKTWQSMKARCEDTGNASYKYYGQAGVTYEPRWKEFINFLEDMGTRPVGMTLDRIDTSLGYYKANCKWSTYKEQANNRSNNVAIEYEGRIVTALELSHMWGITDTGVRHRLKRFFSEEDGVLKQVATIISRNRKKKEE